MATITDIFTNKRWKQLDKSRDKSIERGDMIATRDTSQALRYEGKGLKKWSGRQNSWAATNLIQQGFNKIAKLRIAHKVTKKDLKKVDALAHRIDQLIKKVLRTGGMKVHKGRKTK